MPEIQPPIQADELKNYVSQYLETNISTVDTFVDNYLDECFDVIFESFTIDCIGGFDNSASVRGFVNRREKMNQAEIDKGKTVILGLLESFKKPKNFLKGKKGVKLTKILKFFDNSENNRIEIAKIIASLTRNNINSSISNSQSGERITPAILAKNNKILAQNTKEQIKANITQVVTADILKNLVSENKKQADELSYIKVAITSMLEQVVDKMGTNPDIKELSDNILALINSSGWYTK